MMERMQQLLTYFDCLIAAEKVGHSVHSELTEVIDAMRKEVGLIDSTIEARAKRVMDEVRDKNK